MPSPFWNISRESYPHHNFTEPLGEINSLKLNQIEKNGTHRKGHKGKQLVFRDGKHRILHKQCKIIDFIRLNKTNGTKFLFISSYMQKTHLPLNENPQSVGMII